MLVATAVLCPAALAEGFFSNLDYEVNAGLNIGGSAPLPLPEEIREIKSFNPRLNVQFGVEATKWLNQKWGVALGVRFDTKSMETKARVKNYGMAILQNGQELSGRWTGNVNTKYQSAQLALPITAIFKLNERLSFNLGPYIALALHNSFDGSVYEGYLREGDPTGMKVSFEGDAQATYDFDSELRKFQWGMQCGASWNVHDKWNINANLTWGCNDIFKSSFKTITFALYPIYLNLGMGYCF